MTEKKNKAATGKLEVRQIRSEAGRNKRVKAQLNALGLGPIGKTVVIPANPATIGMVKKLGYLLEITEIK